MTILEECRERTFCINLCRSLCSFVIRNDIDIQSLVTISSASLQPQICIHKWLCNEAAAKKDQDGNHLPVSSPWTQTPIYEGNLQLFLQQHIDKGWCHVFCTVQLSSSESPHLLNSPIEDALIEDLGRGRCPDCPDEFVSVGVWPRPGAGDHWLVRAAWNIRADDGRLSWWIQTTPVIRTESVLVPRLFLATQE